MLTLHTALFLSFALLSLTSVPVMLSYPSSAPYYFWGFLMLAVAVPLSWKLYGGCPCTVWEKRLLKQESRPLYEKPCIDHYSHMWLGLRLRPKMSTYALLFLLLLPLAVSALTL